MRIANLKSKAIREKILIATLIAMPITLAIAGATHSEIMFYAFEGDTSLNPCFNGS